MVLERRRRPLATAMAWVVVLALLVGGAIALTRPDGSPTPAPAQADRPAGAPTSTTVAVDDTPAPGRSALVTVAVANVWNAPGVARTVDETSLTNPVDIRRWIAAMSHDDKLWLVDRLVTQALYGERVVVREVAGAWARVVVTGQPSSLDPDGYPGWIPTVQLRAAEAPATPTSAVVITPSAQLLKVGQIGELLDLSYNTRLPVLNAGATHVTVALPTGGRGLLAVVDVDVRPPGPRATTPGDLGEPAASALPGRGRLALTRR